MELIAHFFAPFTFAHCSCLGNSSCSPLRWSFSLSPRRIRVIRRGTKWMRHSWPYSPTFPLHGRSVLCIDGREAANAGRLHSWPYACGYFTRVFHTTFTYSCGRGIIRAPGGRISSRRRSFILPRDSCGVSKYAPNEASSSHLCMIRGPIRTVKGEAVWRLLVMRSSS